MSTDHEAVVTSAPQGLTGLEEVLREEIEVLEEEVEVLAEEIDREFHHPEPRYHVEADNQDDGDVARIFVSPHRTIGEVVARVYSRLGRQRRPGDRLFRVSDGQDVFVHEQATVQAYVHAAGAHDRASITAALHWAYRADTGGADR